jgi:hypothetical protein
VAARRTSNNAEAATRLKRAIARRARDLGASVVGFAPDVPLGEGGRGPGSG